MTQRLPWAPGSATGVGPMPGTDPVEAATLVVGELGSLPHLPQLPARGAGADAVGRTAALLVDLHVEVAVGRWRLVPRPTRDHQRARELVARDLDAMEQAAQGHRGVLKVQLLGPWTLACQLELPGGQQVLADPSAVRDVAASLAEGVAAHRRDLRLRLPGVERVVTELDEPLLAVVLAGQVPTASGWGRHPAVEESAAVEVEGAVLEAAGEGGGVRLGGRAAPVGLARRAAARFLSLGVDALGAEMEEQLGEALEAGVGLLAGVVPPSHEGPADLDALAAPLRRLWRRLGLHPALLPQTVVVTPSGGLEGVTPGQAAAVLRRCRELADRLLADPEGAAP